MGVILDLYDECTKTILQSLNGILSHPDVEGLPISAVLAVGGFAASDYVVNALRNGLSQRGIRVLRPNQAEITVVKGAVPFGQKEDIIYSRIMPYTYGVGCVINFNERHRADHKIEDGGKVLAVNCFRKYVSRGQTVKLGEWIGQKPYYPDDDAQSSASIHVFVSDKTDPTHIDEKGCK
ncbi:hypothetical protein DPMN_000330 [Dreissena polymorpha]|uniref:Uncharacterized protein n=1 Tax=Dreissena polymorpha TaxID=45954 RepID=A0A9D4MHT6_DREPO|nr:hypothetical protein DPMN_000330 [Dreissena polymorpha]